MAATTDQQISLTIAPRGSSSHLNRPARQFVAAFLQKLYEVVDDPANRDLIRWSDTGDSFFVLDKERFENEVLAHRFKHSRFSGFACQLNMSGTLNTPNDFQRGQPDLLHLIQRKMQGQMASGDVHAAPGPAVGEDAAVAALSAVRLENINN